MNKIKSFLSKDIKEYNKVILSLGCIAFLLCVGILSYFISSSFALFSGEVSGSRNIKMRYTAYTKNFSYKGEPEEYKVKNNGYYYIEMAGASGGNSSYGSYGALTSGYIYLEKDTKLYFYVGKKGENTTSGTNCKSSGYEFNGGGISTPVNGNCGPTGGGATDVRLVGGAWNDTSSLISRIMVAGAGGGAAATLTTYMTGSGGTLNGEKAFSANTTYNPQLGNPGTQIAGGAAATKYTGATSGGTAGSFGIGGTGGGNASGNTSGGGGGGGAGYYGGSGASGAGGGSFPSAGGSSYISGYAGVNSVAESTTITHTNQTKHYSGKYFIGADMIAAQNEGNGYAKIRYVGTKPERKNTKLNNVRYIKDCINYNTINQGNHWSEIQAIKDGVNIAKGKTVTGTTAAASDRPYSRITDGDLTPSNWSNASSQAANQCVTVDLGATYDLDEVALWNYFGDSRVYESNNFSVSSDNSTWTNLTNNEVWYETSNGARWNAYIDHINGYVGYSNMYVWYDGYSNTGTTKNFSTTTWKNLVYASNSATNAGTIMNGTAAGASWGNKFLTLDGTNDFVRIAVLNYAKPTIEVVFSPTKSHTDQSVVISNYEGGGYGINVQGGNHVYGQYYIGAWYTTGYDTSPVVETNTIGQVATSYDQTTMKLFKDGKLNQSAAQAGSIGTPASSTVMAVGTNPYGTAGAAGYFQGRIYSVRIYNTPLTDEQIYHNYLYDKQLFRLD